MLFTEIVLLVTKSENMGASWAQGFFPESQTVNKMKQ